MLFASLSSLHIRARLSHNYAATSRTLIHFIGIRRILQNTRLQLPDAGFSCALGKEFPFTLINEKSRGIYIIKKDLV